MWLFKKKKKLCPCLCHFKLIAGHPPTEEHCESCAGWEAEQRRKRQAYLAGPQHSRRKLIDSCDNTMSLVIRIGGNWTCIKCKRTYPPVVSKITKLPAQNIMTNSHFFGRGNWGTRYDLENGDPMDIFCHSKIENHKDETIEGFNYTEYMIKKVGTEKFEHMKIKAKMRMQYKEHHLIAIQTELRRSLMPLLSEYQQEYAKLP